MAALPVVEAFRAEAERLSQMVSAEDAASLARASPCPPWTLAELLYHVRIGVSRVPAMLAEPEPEPEPEPGAVPEAGAGYGALVPAPGYYRRDQRFSAAVNAGRITAARQGAALLTPAAIAGEFGQVWREAWELASAAEQARVVRTRHGDRMLLTEFLRTRVLELAVHGLDIAAGLGREPWLTPAAARVVEDLILPAGSAGALLAESGWDQVTLIAAATGRRPLTPAEGALAGRHGIRSLALG